MSFMNWLKWKVAGDELNELHRIKTRIITVRDWCSEFEDVRATTKYLLDNNDYPRQFCGAFGSITDFREYLRSDKTKKVVQGELTFAEVFPEIADQATCPMQRLSMYENMGVIVATVPQMISLHRHALVSDYVKDLNYGNDFSLWCELDDILNGDKGDTTLFKFSGCEFKIIKG